MFSRFGLPKDFLVDENSREESDIRFFRARASLLELGIRLTLPRVVPLHSIMRLG